MQFRRASGSLMKCATIPWLVALACLAPTAVVRASFVVQAAQWDDPLSGHLGTVGFQLTGLSSPFFGLAPRVYTGPDFAAPPLGRVQATTYGASNSWTITFSAPLPKLYVYVDLWRGAYTAHNVDPSTHYAFDRSFTIASGVAGAGVGGNTLTLPWYSGFFYSGILEFSGPLTSLSVTSDGMNEAGQYMTFATEVSDSVNTSVPEPANVVVFSILATLALVSRWRSRRSSESQFGLFCPTDV